MPEHNRHRRGAVEPRRVLMIAAAFPPAGGPGVQRTAKFAKYLPHFGWYPIVWTAEAPPDLPRDESLLEDLPADLEIHRESVHPLFRGAVVRAFHGAARRTASVMSIASALCWRREIETVSPRPESPWRNWAMRSVAPLVSLAGRQPIRAIYATFSPEENLWLGLMLKKRTGLPLVVDFRDLWTDDYRYVAASPKRRTEDSAFQQAVLERADAVIGVTPSQTRILATHVPHAAEKFTTITNGFDPDDFRNIDWNRPERHGAGHCFVLSHVGRLDRWRSTDALIHGLCRFAAAAKRTGARFELRIVGHGNERTLSRLAAGGVPVAHQPYVGHGEAIAEMCRADALLLAMPDGPNAKTVIAAKVFEYLAAGRPILVVGPRGGECEKIVRKHAAGVAAGLDANEVAQRLQELLDGWRRGRLAPVGEAQKLRSYSRIALARKLSNVLEKVCGGSPARVEDSLHEFREREVGGVVEAHPLRSGVSIRERVEAGFSGGAGR